MFPRASLTCVLTLFIAVGKPWLSAQHMEHDSAGHAATVPPGILDLPITIRVGVGTMHQKVATSIPRAQAFYDQGLAYVHSYVWIDAARSFNQALRLDPQLGMAYLGLADAYIGLQDVPAARSAWAKAHDLAQSMSASERTWLAIRDREISFLEAPSQEKYAAYSQAVDEATQANPRDPWLWVQRGLAVEASPFTHGQASGDESLGFYKKALALDLDNLAAFHYAIHAHENLGQIKEALAESATYARLAYAIPHAHHMHGHALMRAGRTEEAIQEFLKANELEEAWFRSENIPTQYDWHYAHNLQLLALNYELLGQDRNAEQLLRRAFTLPSSTEFLAYNRRAWPEFLIATGRYDEALQVSRELAHSDFPLAIMAGHTLAGEALLGLNRMNDAQSELTMAEEAAQHVSDRVLVALPYPAALKAAIRLREGHTQQGEEIYVKVEQSAVATPGPDGWIAAIFVLESIARDARNSGDWPLAQYTAEKMIQHNPYYAGGHFAIALVAEHAGEGSGAREMFSEAARLWVHADPDLPELITARGKLAAHN